MTKINKKWLNWKRYFIKKMSIKKVRAFTIIEVTIAMLITGLLIAVTYTSYSIIVKSYQAFSTKHEDLVVLNNIDHLLKRDFFKAEIIYKTSDGIQLKQNNTEIGYEFKPGYIVRHAVRIDTFKVQTLEVIATFENLPITDVQAVEEQNRIDGLSFTLVYKNEQIPYIYHKMYSSVNLINRIPNASN